MRTALTLALVVSLALPAPLDGAGNSWNRLRYSGGTVEAKVNPFDWNTTLTVTPDELTLVFSGRRTARIKTSAVTALSYGQTAHRRVADLVALSAIATPLVLFGLLHKSKAHFIGIEYRDEAGKPGALLLEADKNHYRGILQVLGTVTGQPVKNAP
jgi:hypothetical protein